MPIYFMKRKKWFICGIFLFLFFLFFSFSLIANPFESSYEKPVFSLLPNVSTVALYIPQPNIVIKEIKDFLPWQKIQKSTSWKEFTKTVFFKEQYNQIPWEMIEHFRDMLHNKYNGIGEKLLQEFLTQELALVEYFYPKSLLYEYAAITRISYKFRVLYGLLNFLPSQLGMVNISKERGTYCFRFFNQSAIYVKKYHDILIMANSLYLVQEIQKNINHTSSITFDLNSHNQVYCYMKPTEYEPEEITDNIDCVYANFKLHSGNIASDIQIKPKEDTDWLKLYFSNKFRLDQYPKDTFLATQLNIPWLKLWQDLLSDTRYRPEDVLYKKFGVRIPQEYQNFIQDNLIPHLGEDVSFSISSIDFNKEKIDVFDPYPAFSLMIRCEKTEEVFNNIKELIEKINEQLNLDASQNPNFNKNEKLTISYNEEYAGCPIIRIKFPDFSGGAIRPSIAIFDSSLVITTHTAFIKSLYDCQDGAEEYWNTNAYNKARKLLSGSALCYLETKGMLENMSKLEKKLETWAEWYRGQYRYDRQLSTFFTSWKEIFYLCKSLPLYVSMQTNRKNNALNINISIQFE